MQRNNYSGNGNRLKSTESSDPSQYEQAYWTQPFYRAFTCNDTKQIVWTPSYDVATGSEQLTDGLGCWVLPRRRSWGCCGPSLWPGSVRWWKPVKAAPPAPPGCWRFLPVTHSKPVRWRWAEWCCSFIVCKSLFWPYQVNPSLFSLLINLSIISPLKWSNRGKCQSQISEQRLQKVCFVWPTVQNSKIFNL